MKGLRSSTALSVLSPAVECAVVNVDAPPEHCPATAVNLEDELADSATEAAKADYARLLAQLDVWRASSQALNDPLAAGGADGEWRRTLKTEDVLLSLARALHGALRLLTGAAGARVFVRE